MDSKQHVEIALRCGIVAWNALEMQRSTDALVIKLQCRALISEVKSLLAVVDAAVASAESPVKSPNKASAPCQHQWQNGAGVGYCRKCGAFDNA